MHVVHFPWPCFPPVAKATIGGGSYVNADEWVPATSATVTTVPSTLQVALGNLQNMELDEIHLVAMHGVPPILAEIVRSLEKVSPKSVTDTNPDVPLS